MASSDQLLTYLDAIGSTSALKERATRLLALYQAFPGIEPDDFFVSETAREDGSRVFEALLLFTNSLMMEARIPGEGDEQFDFVPLDIHHLVIESKDFNMRDPTQGSRMRVEVWLGAQRFAEMKASGANCEFLREIVQRRLLPNLRPAAA